MSDHIEDSKPRQEAMLRRQDIIWQHYHSGMLHSDRAGVDIGISALKTSVFINAGALVALLTFLGQLWDKADAPRQQILCSVHYFVYGLIAAAAAFITAYFYQSCVTASYMPALKEIPLSSNPQPRRLSHFTSIFRVLMILAGLASFILFVIGTFSTFNTLTAR